MKMKQATAIREKLLTDKTSTDEELLKHFVEDIGISEKTAKEFLCSRKVYQTHPAFQTPTNDQK